MANIKENIQKNKTNLSGPLSAMSANGLIIPSSDSRVSTVEELLAKTNDLLIAPEAQLGQGILDIILKNSTPRTITLKPQPFLSPKEFEGYAFRYKNGQSFTNPAEDVYVVTNTSGIPIAYGSRSSICPPLANTPKIARLANNSNPICVAGVQPCLRQEVQTDSDRIRYPWFTQTDFELIMLTTSGNAEREKINLDAYSCIQLVNALKASGIPQENIKLRLNNYMEIIIPLLGDVPWVQKEIFGYQGLNELAGLRSQQINITNPSLYKEKQKTSISILNELAQQYNIPGENLSFFLKLIDTGKYDFSLLQDNVVRNKVISASLRLNTICTIINEIFGQEIAVRDDLSYRGGYPGYDETTMQADIITKNKIYSEVAGGGAYPLALQEAANILKANQLMDQQAYAVGFALGNARVLEATKSFSNNENFTKPLKWTDFKKKLESIRSIQ